MSSSYRCVLFIPRVCQYDAYHNPSSEWADLLCPASKNTIRGTALDAVVIATLLTPADKDLVLDGCFDGSYTYFASDGFTYGSTSSNWQDLGSWSREHSLIWAPSAGPG